MFSQLGATRKRDILKPYLNSLIQLCDKRSATFNEIMGSIGRLYMNTVGNSTDFSNMYDMISKNENPFADKKISTESAIFLRENISDLGRTNMKLLRDKCGNDIIPSRYEMDKYVKENNLLPELGTYIY